MSSSPFRVKCSSLEKAIKGLKRREKFILDIYSSNRTFCSLHDFIS